MNCPKCGRKLSGLQCACKYLVNRDHVILVGESPEDWLHSLESYIISFSEPAVVPAPVTDPVRDQKNRDTDQKDRAAAQTVSPSVSQPSGDILDLDARQLAERMIGSYTREGNGADYYFDRLHPEKGAELTRQGIKKVEKFSGIKDLNDPDPLFAAIKKSIIASINKKETDKIKLKPVLNPPSMPKTLNEKKPSQQDREKAEAVTRLIERIGIGTARYTEEFKTKLREARSAYTALTPLQKTLVDKESWLIAAETKYEELRVQFSKKNKRVFMSLAINIVFALLFAIVMINQTYFEWFITNSGAIAMWGTVLLFSSTADLMGEEFKPRLLGTIGVLLSLIPIFLGGIFELLSGTAPVLYERIAEIDLRLYFNLAMALGLMFQSSNEFSKLFDYFQEHHASRKKTLSVLFYLILLLLCVTLVFGFAKNIDVDLYSNMSKANQIQTAPDTDRSDYATSSDTSKIEPHYYCYDDLSYNDLLNFGPGVWVDPNETVDFNCFVYQAFCERLETDPAMAAAVLAYADKQLGTRYSGRFYSEIEDDWIAGINDTAKTFVNDTGLWVSETTAFEELLEKTADIRIIDAGGEEIEILKMQAGSEQPIICGPERIGTTAPFKYLCFTITVKDTKITLLFLIDLGFTPVI